MNGNPAVHAAFFGALTLLMVPYGAALLRGWAPRWMRRRNSPAVIRAHGAMALLVYAGAAFNVLPRLLDASQDAVLAGTVAGGVLTVCGVVLPSLVDARERRRTPER